MDQHSALNAAVARRIGGQPTAPVTEKPKEKYRVLVGRCTGEDGLQYGVGVKNDDGSPREIVESSVDLVAKFNRPNSRKFEKLMTAEQAGAPIVNAKDRFDQMDKAQLAAFALEENIVLDPKTMHKKDMVLALRNRVPLAARTESDEQTIEPPSLKNNKNDEDDDA